MADIGNLYFDILLRDMTDADIDKIKKKLEKVGVKIGADVDRKTFEANIKAALRNKTFDVNLSAGKNIKKAAIEANKSILTKSVTDALKGKTFTADLKLVVRNATVQDAIRQAFAQAGMSYNTTASDVRAQRILEIQQRMAIRAANAQRNLGNSYRYSASGAHESARASVVLGRSLHANIRLAGELGTALGNFASVFGIKDLLQDIVRIGGQLENQRIALGSILQDGGKATEMFSKIQALAVKSPFGIMDLNQYTKQLSAYGIEYNELYDTMKRMADISAGVGVDMGRIILAFGQVKAAGFLKGTELRQFTEANIPMVDKLAERFSNLERRIVSAGEVYDMISKKKVTFEDVKSVLWDLTGEGGMFNNMQEVLSESLASKWKNLADAIDVMYGRIADGGIGSGLKSLAETLTELTKNWEYVASAIGTATGSYLAYKAAVLLGGRQIATAKTTYEGFIIDKRKEANNLRIASTYRELTRAEQMLIDTSGRLTAIDARRLIQTGVMNKELALQLIATKKLDAATVSYLASIYRLDAQMVQTAKRSTWFSRALVSAGNAIRGFGLAMKSFLLNPTTWVFAGLTAITELFTYYSKKQDEIDERNKNFAESAKGSAETLERELVKIKDLDIAKLNTDEMKVKIKEFTTIIQNEADGWQSILSEIFAKEADGTFKNSVEEQLKMLKTKMEELAEAKKKLMGDDESYSDVIGSTETGWWLWEKDIVDRVKAYSEAVEENDKRLKDLAIHARDVSTAIDIATAGNKELSNSLEGKNLNDQVALLKDYKTEWGKFIVELTKSNSDAAQIVNEWYNNIEKYFVKGKEGEMLWDFSLAKKALINELTLRGEDINNLSEGGRQLVLGFVDELIKEGNVQKPKVQQYVYDWFTGQFGLPRNDLNYIVPSQITNIVSGEAGGSKKDAVAEMWKKRAAEIEKAVKMYDQWKKVEGKLLAENRVKNNEELANLFNGAYGFNLDLENPTEAYEYIQSKLNKNLSAQKELMISLGVKISDAEFKDAQDKLKSHLDETKKFIDRITSQWDLYKDIFEATSDKDVSANIAFSGNISFKDQIEQIRAEIEKQLSALGSEISFDELIGMDTITLEEAGLSSLSELIKAYNKENQKLKDESVKNFLEIIKASKDFEQQIADIERKLQKDLADLTANSKGMSSEELERRRAELIKKAEEDKTKVRFEEFKESSDWVKVFDDLDRVSDTTLDNMISKIEEFARQAHLSEEVTKQLVEAMGKLRDESIERNPFEGFKEAWNRASYWRNYDVNAAYNKQFNDKTGKFEQKLSQEQVDNNLAEANDDLKDSALAVADKFQAVANAADLLNGLFQGLGVDLSGLSDIVGGIASGTQTGAGVAAAFGATGPWGAIIGAGIGLLSSVFAMHDKALQKEIEASEAREKYIKEISDTLKDALDRNLGGLYTMKIDVVTNAKLKQTIKDYERLSQYLSNPDSIDSASEFRWIREYSHLTKDAIDTMRDAIKEDSYFDAQLALLKLQRDEVTKQKKLEEEKKGTDQSKIDDYNLEIAQLEESIKNLSADIANELYGIDFKDWANQLAESLVDAWSKGEDAVLAYKNTVNDILRDVGVSVISQKILEPALQNTMDSFLAQFEKDNGKLTDDSMKILSGMYEGAEYAAQATEAYLEGLKELGIDVSEKDSESGGLSKGIQSVTEDTANLLASYLNATRQDVSVNRSLFEKLIGEDVPQMSYIAQAQLQQLQMIATNTQRNADAADRIYDLVNRVVDKGSNKLKI